MDNPFLRQDLPIRWQELRAEHVVPAIDLALARAQAAIDRISSGNVAPLTYESTFLALEQATEELNTTWAKVSHLQSVADSPELREAYAVILPRVTTFFARVPLNEALWSRLRAFGDSPEAASLTGLHRRFVEETMKDFREAGADLPLPRRQRLESLQSELAQLTQKYAENVLDATNGWQLVIPPEEEARLAGLPEHAKSAARASAEAKGVPGWRFTLHQPSMEPFLTYLDDDELRRQMWQASAAVGASEPFDNTALIGRILTLRQEKAQILGQPHFAECVLHRRMAKSAARALEFVTDFERRCAEPFSREIAELERYVATRTGRPRRALAPWQVMYWAEKLRQEKYNFDQEVLRPYFPMPHVVAGLFELVRRVFGLRVTRREQEQVERWHSDVEYFDIHDREGRHLGSFYSDWYPREAKRGGAWMNYLVTGGPTTDGRRVPHLGVICGNLTPPAAGRPSLLTHREVETIFHEFGHLLHHLLGEVEIKSLNGINVAWDFVELPSQIMENWAWERESLDLFARHYQSGELIPDEIFQKMSAARQFRAACATMRQVALAKLDLLLHTQTEQFAAEVDLEPRLRSAIEACLVPTVPPAPTIVKRFTHIFSDPVGYAAGYYSYKWAEVLEADAFTRFKSEGIFNSAVGREFIDKILSRGNSADPAELFRSFMGRDPTPQALLVRSGLGA